MMCMTLKNAVEVAKFFEVSLDEFVEINKH